MIAGIHLRHVVTRGGFAAGNRSDGRTFPQDMNRPVQQHRVGGAPRLSHEVVGSSASATKPAGHVLVDTRREATRCKGEYAMCDSFSNKPSQTQTKKGKDHCNKITCPKRKAPHAHGGAEMQLRVWAGATPDIAAVGMPKAVAKGLESWVVSHGAKRANGAGSSANISYDASTHSH